MHIFNKKFGYNEHFKCLWEKERISSLCSILCYICDLDNHNFDLDKSLEYCMIKVGEPLALLHKSVIRTGGYLVVPESNIGRILVKSTK